jgi:hypothetical protein
MKKTAILLFWMLPAGLLIIGCSEGQYIWGSGPAGAAAQAEGDWTIMVYMAADNELEGQAIEDINEMEAAPAGAADVQVVCLLDRSDAYDTSNGNWSDSRLLAVCPDAGGENGVLVSEVLSCEALSLGPQERQELNTGEPATLSIFMSFCRERYPARYYALILWGHGSGYRSTDALAPQAVLRGSGCDEGSGGDVLTTPELGTALSENPVDVLALDLCFGATLETAYEICADASLLIAGQGAVPGDGWNYRDFLYRLGRQGGAPRDFAEAAVGSFSEEYGANASTDISVIDLASVPSLFESLNSLSEVLFANISDGAARDSLRNLFFNSAASCYSTPGDLYLDLYDAADKAAAHTGAAAEEAAQLKTRLETAVLMSWVHPQAGNLHGLGVHYIPLDEAGYPKSHTQDYFRDYPVPYPLKFVASSAWVPCYPEGPGLLYRLWYEDLP